MKIIDKRVVTRPRDAGRKPVWALVALALGSLVLASCGSGSTGDEGEKSDAKGDRAIGVNLPFTENDPWIPLMAGAEMAAKERGYTLLRSSSNLNVETQVNEINAWLGQPNVAAVTIFPLDSSTLNPVLDRAVDRGVKVVAYASSIPGAQGENLFDDESGGKGVAEAAAEYAKEHFDGEANIAVISMDGSEVNRLRKEAMLNRIKELLPDSKIVAEAEGQTAAEGLEIARPILQAHPEVNIFLSHNDPPCGGVSQAVQQSGREVGEVWCGGLDGSKIWLDKLKSGQAVGASGALDLIQIGKDTVNIAANLVEGNGPAESLQKYEIVTQDTPDLLDKFIEQYSIN